MEQKLKDAAAEEEKSDSDGSSSDDSSSTTSSSGIGLKKGQKAKAKPRKKAKAKAAPSNTSLEKPDVPKSEKSEKSDKGLSAAGVLEKSKSSLNSLKEVSTLSIWMGNIKAKDATARVSKGLDLVGKCEKFPGEPECVNMVAELTSEVNRVSQQSEVLAGLQSPDVEGILINSKEAIANIVLEWKKDDLASFLTEIGKKLCEALIKAEGKQKVFFDFLSLKPSDSWLGFGAAFLQTHAQDIQHDGRVELLSSIALAQQALLNFFIDKFRAMSTPTEGLLQALPKKWFIPTICRCGPWLE